MKYDAIAQAYKQMITESLILSEDMLMEDRIDYLKANTKEFDTSHDTTGQHKTTDAIIDHFAQNGDPSKNKQHTQYILGLYRKKAIRQEDAYKVHDALTEFDKHKNKLSPEEKQLTVKNYPTLKSLQDKVAPFAGMASTNAEAAEMAKKQEYDIPGHRKMYEDDKIKIYRLTDKATSQKLYGKANDPKPGVFPTDWCTATQSDSHNMFDHYSKPDQNLHVIHRKSDGAVFQYHTHTGQFMDKNDEVVQPDGADFASIKDSLHKAWDQNPDLLHG